jgi:hypothetical protein
VRQIKRDSATTAEASSSGCAAKTSSSSCAAVTSSSRCSAVTSSSRCSTVTSSSDCSAMTSSSSSSAMTSSPGCSTNVTRLCSLESRLPCYSDDYGQLSSEIGNRCPNCSSCYLSKERKTCDVNEMKPCCSCCSSCSQSETEENVRRPAKITISCPGTLRNLKSFFCVVIVINLKHLPLWC